MVTTPEQHNDNLILEIRGDLNVFLRTLRKGMLLKGRIVATLADDRYILRIRGYNMIAVSRNPLVRFDEIRLKVTSVSPVLVLEQDETPTAMNTDPAVKKNQTADSTNLLVY